MSHRMMFGARGGEATTMQPFESCTQPECFLREDGVDSRSLAELIVRALAGEDVAMQSPIQPYERCVGCVQCVLQGGRPLPTIEEVERYLELGRWTYRRSQRRRRREAR